MIQTNAITITPEMLRLISEIDVFNEGWKFIRTITPERLESLRRVATIESIGSSTRIEGAKLTDGQIESLLGKIGKQSFSSRDEQEVIGYAEVMETIFQSYKEIAVSDNFVQQLHALLLRHSSKDERHRGLYKTLSNNVEAFDADGKSLGVIFQTASPFETPRKMEELLRWTREALEDNAWHPLIVVGVFNVVFLAIHPFQDGNGRLSRILATLLLLKAGYQYVPYSSLESVIEKNKEAYYLALQRTQKSIDTEQADWLPWLQFFLRSLKTQKEHLAKKIERAEISADLPAECVTILEYLKTTTRLTMREAEGLVSIPRPTLKTRFNLLVEKGLIERHGKGRGSWYSLVGV